MKKRLLFMLSTLMLMLCVLSLPTQAAKISVKKGGKMTSISGSLVKVRYGSTMVADCTRSIAPALEMKNKVMVPAMTLFGKNSIHAKCTYNKATHKLTIKHGKRKLVFKTGSKTVKANGTSMTLNKAPFTVTFQKSGIYDVMVPARQTAIYLGFNYEYNDKKNILTLKEKKNASQSATRSTQLRQSNFLKKVGPLARADYQRTGILASVTLAQAILESGWGRSSLAKKSNNLFGITKGRSMWKGGGWDGSSSSATKSGTRFRKYSCIEDSISDHSAYLRNCKNGRHKRYAGITKTKSYRKQFQIIRKGGYCTSSSYVSQLCHIVKRYHLTKYDKK